MVEVFKTNVGDQRAANTLVNEIRKNFIYYSVNFDLEDCDRILRIECTMGVIQSSRVIDLLRDLGFTAEILPDDIFVDSAFVQYQ